MEHVEYHLSELVDLLEGIEGTDKLKAMLEQVRKEAEEQATRRGWTFGTGHYKAPEEQGTPVPFIKAKDFCFPVNVVCIPPYPPRLFILQNIHTTLNRQMIHQYSTQWNVFLCAGCTGAW